MFQGNIPFFYYCMTNIAMQNKHYIKSNNDFNKIIVSAIRLILSVLLFGGLVSGCSIAKRVNAPKNRIEPSEKLGSFDTKSQILDSVVKSWIGVPYRYGGTSKSGVDCSGLVSAIYKEAFQINLPRSTTELLSIIQVIEENSLQPGDLVFYEIEKEKEFHVGIYLGNGKFVHASSIRGVMISNMEEAYFRQRFYKAGKIKNTLLK